MRVVESSYDNKIVLALGLFDSVHRGHALLLSEAKNLAKDLGADLAVFTFRNNPFKFYGIERGMVFTFDERLPAFDRLGVNVVIGKTMSEEYARTSPKDFLDDLFNNFNIVGVVSGADYTFGYKGEGNIEYLKEYAENKGAVLKIVPYLCTEDGDKISSNLIRKYLLEGKVHTANMLMGRTYKISGDVVHGFARGREFGFPTANILVSDEKCKIKEGVYATKVEVDGFEYNSLTNIGIKPTFNDYTVTVESVLIEYKGNLYNKKINVFFYDKIRDIKKFNSEDEIRDQIEKDIAIASLVDRQI